MRNVPAREPRGPSSIHYRRRRISSNYTAAHTHTQREYIIYDWTAVIRYRHTKYTVARQQLVVCVVVTRARRLHYALYRNDLFLYLLFTNKVA